MARTNRIEKTAASKKSKIFFSTLFIGFTVLFLVSALVLALYYLQSKKEQSAFDQLVFTIEGKHLQGESRNFDLEALLSFDESKSTHSGLEIIDQSILSHYQTLHMMNSDFIGWVKVENSKINYPVMYTPDDPEYYLRRAFDKTAAISGTPFIDVNCNLLSDVTIIYGHNMNNDSMFGTLDYYKDVRFWQENPTFSFDTLDKRQQFEVFAVLESRVQAEKESNFRYYEQCGVLTAPAHAELMSWLIDHSLYDTGVVPRYGNHIVILSTCSYHTADGRFLVAAQKVHDGPVKDPQPETH
ncbi:MAG: class B sortase [Chloroflexi bacterium]|jgi:sortase B|nr:class B sortase [Chloroflexota bacterium]